MRTVAWRDSISDGSEELFQEAGRPVSYMVFNDGRMYSRAPTMAEAEVKAHDTVQVVLLLFLDKRRYKNLGS